MIKIILIFTTLKSLVLCECLNNDERTKLKMTLENLKPSNFYQSVPNYIQCNNKTLLDEFVCKNSDLSDMFLFSSYANYSLQSSENELSYIFNKNENINQDNICFDLKYFSGGLGAYYYPYKMAHLTTTYTNTHYIQENKHGAVFTNREGEKIYLGKNCDVIDDKNQKGYWYEDDGVFYLINQKDNGKKFKISDSLDLDTIDNTGDIGFVLEKEINLNKIKKCTEDKVKKLMRQ